MPSQHKHPPISFRPPEWDRLWLLAYAQQTGQPVNRILAQWVHEKRAEAERLPGVLTTREDLTR